MPGGDIRKLLWASSAAITSLLLELDVAGWSFHRRFFSCAAGHAKSHTKQNIVFHNRRNYFEFVGKAKGFTSRTKSVLSDAICSRRVHILGPR